MSPYHRTEWLFAKWNDLEMHLPKLINFSWRITNSLFFTVKNKKEASEQTITLALLNKWIKMQRLIWGKSVAMLWGRAILSSIQEKYLRMELIGKTGGLWWEKYNMSRISWGWMGQGDCRSFCPILRMLKSLTLLKLVRRKKKAYTNPQPFENWKASNQNGSNAINPSA